MANDLPTLGEPGGGRKRKQQSQDEAGFWESAFSAASRELVGMDPYSDVRRYRAEHPKMGFLSRVAGEIPYFTFPLIAPGRAAARTLPIFGRGIRSGERLISEGRPVLGQVSQDVAAMSAFESGRLGATAALGGDVSEVAQEAFFELALVGGASSALGYLSRSLPPAKASSAFEIEFQKALDPEFDPNAPPQVKMRRMADKVEEVEDQGTKDEIYRHIAKYSSQVRKQDVPSRRNAVQKLDNPNENENRRLSKKLSDLFDVKTTKNFTVRKVLSSRQQGGLGGPKRSRDAPSSADEVINRAGIPEGHDKFTYLPRYVRINTKDQARKFQKTLDEISAPINVAGRQTWITREANDGAYVMVRRLSENTDPVKQGDEFLTFKTDNPEFFGPELSGFNRVMDDTIFELESMDELRAPEGSVTKTYYDAKQSLPEVGVMAGEMTRGADKNSMARGIVEKMLGEDRIAQFRHTFGKSADWLGIITREFAAPTINRYGGPNGSARAAAISLASKLIWDRARMESTHILSGELPKSYKNSIWKDVFNIGAPIREGGIFRRIDELSNDSLPDITRAFRENLSLEEMSQRGMRRDAIDFMRFLDQQDRHVIRDFNRIMRDLGYEEFEGMENHYMLSRMWEGRIRIPIRKKNGNIVAVASGKHTNQARDEADELVRIINDEETFSAPVSANKDEIRYADEGEDLNQITDFNDRQARQNINWLRRARNPDRFDTRKGVRGFAHERNDFSHKDLRQILGKQVREMYELAAHRTVDKKLWDQRMKLKSEEPQFFRMLEAELASRAGQRGNWSKASEDAVDRILTPVFGTRASEIVRATNNAIFQLTLGMGNIGFAALNAVTFMQTALPEIAWLMKAPPAAVRPMYGSNIVKTPQGMGEIHSLSPLKFVSQAMGDLSSPPDELWEIYKRARDEGRVAPVLSEEVFGPNSDIIRHLRGFFKEHRTLPETIQEISAYMPARTEELSRSMALSMGWRMGRDFMGLSGENLYQFATRFVDNTHFRYTAADRPLLMRGAFGSLVGLFKSWMMHYVGNMTRYSSAAARRGQFGPLLWSQAGTMSVAGLSGTAILPLAEGMNGLMSDEPLVQNLYEGLGWNEMDEFHYTGDAADAIYFGLPSFLNLSLSHRAAVPGADIPNDIEQLYSIMHWDRAVALGDIVGSTMDAFYATGEHPARSQEVMDAMYRAFLPRTFQAAMKNVGQRGTRSLRTQNTILSESTWQETTMAAAGFQPNRLARTYEMMDVMFERQQEKQEAIAAFGEMLTQARNANDPAAIQNIMMRAQYQGISPSSIQASANSRQAKREAGIIDRQFDDLRNMALRRAMGRE